MKTFTVLLVITSLTLTSLGRSFEPYRPNGWYYITSGAQDSLSAEPIVTTKDFVSIRLDSFMSERTGKMAYQIVGRVNDQSIKIWADATEQSIGKHIGFVCNNKVVCNPLVNARTESGNFAISGEGPEFKAMYRQIQEDIKNEEIAAEHKKAWEEARKLRASITDTTFLETKRPMSDDAIGPYNYHTGLNEDRAYNQTVYLIAVDRAKKFLSVENDQLVLNLKSGAEINIAEDLFQYITGLFDDWYKWVKEGKSKIIKTEEGYYDIEPTTQKRNNQ